MKRPHLVVAIVAAAAIAAPAAASAAPKRQKVETTTRIVKVSDFSITDATGNGNSPGDITTFTLTVFDRGGTKQVGKGHGTCILGPPEFAMCSSIIDDGRGKVMAMWQDDSDPATDDDIAVVGGTRRYRNARGYGVSKDVDATTFRVVTHLTLR